MENLCGARITSEDLEFRYKTSRLQHVVKAALIIDRNRLNGASLRRHWRVQPVMKIEQRNAEGLCATNVIELMTVTLRNSRIRIVPLGKLEAVWTCSGPKLESGKMWGLGSKNIHKHCTRARVTRVQLTHKLRKIGIAQPLIETMCIGRLTSDKYVCRALLYFLTCCQTERLISVTLVPHTNVPGHPKAKPTSKTWSNGSSELRWWFCQADVWRNHLAKIEVCHSSDSRQNIG